MATNVREFKSGSMEQAAMDALAYTSLEIMRERDNTEREIKSLLESGQDKKALRLMRKHLNVPELRMVKK